MLSTLPSPKRIYHTRQAYYDALVEKTFDGSFPAMRKYAQGNCEDGCQYRIQDEDGRILQCAAGILVPLDEAPPMQGICTTQTIWRKLKPYAPDGMTVDEIREVQMWHDNGTQKGRSSIPHRSNWNPIEQLEKLNKLVCFESVNKRTLETLP